VAVCGRIDYYFDIYYEVVDEISKFYVRFKGALYSKIS